MRLWDCIFPGDCSIIIWGAGNQGKKWLGFLRRIGKHVACFYDANALAIGSIDGIEVRYPSAATENRSILLVSPVRHSENIFFSARELGYRNIVIGNILKFIPRWEELEIDTIFPPIGHFYSLYPDFYEIDERYPKIQFLSRAGNDGIRMNDGKQLSMLRAMNELYDSLPAWEQYREDDYVVNRYRYRVGNPSIGLSDSALLHFMIRLLKPKNFIEIGSGYSSAVTLDTDEFYMERHMNIRFVEPFPELVYSLMKETDDPSRLIIPSRLQDLPVEFFDCLEDGDVLFVDSTHVSKAGSDVNYLFFHVLPRLKTGVYVHLHDIFYPWQYPRQWIMKGMGWNEMFLLRAFLQYNDKWEIVFFNHYMAVEYAEMYHEKWRKIPDLGGGSFWMRKKP